MRRFCIICFSVLLSFVLSAAICAAGDESKFPSAAAQARKISPDQARQKLFYGYVPPAPILHTWPGGYRVIMHDMTNWFIDHALGRY